MQVSSMVVSTLLTVSRLFAGVIFCCGGLVLLGWYLDIPVVKSLQPQWIAMKANTALGFMLIGTGLWGAASGRWPQGGRLLWLVRGAGVLVLLIGALSLAEDISGLDFGIDQLLIEEPPGAMLTVHLGRPAPPTAVCFVLIGLALLLLDIRARRGWYPAEALALAQGLITYAMLIGYVYGVATLYTLLPNFTGMALNTAILFMLASCGLLFCRPERGVMATVTDISPGGTMARILLPVALVLPVALEVLARLSELSPSLAWTTKWDDGEARHSVLVSVLFFVMVLIIARMLAQVDYRRRVAESAQRESEQKFIRTFDQAPIGAAIVSLDGRYLRANQELERITGYAESELLAMNINDITHPEDRTNNLDGMYRLVMGEVNHIDLVKRYVRRDGATVWIQQSVRLMRGDDGEPLYFLPMMTDITAHKRMEEEVFGKAVKLEAVLKAVPAAVWIADDRECQNIVGNQASADLLLRTAGDSVDVRPRKTRLVPQGDGSLMDPTLLRQAVASSQPLHALELELAPHDAPPRFLFGNIAPLQDHQGDPWGAVAAFVDITARKEAELQAEQDRVAAQQANEAKSAFLATMSHELRTPLTSIIGFSEILRDQLFGPIGTPAYLEYAEDICNSGNHLLSLINDVLDIAKIEAGRMALEKVVLPADYVVRGVLRLVNERAARRRLSLTAEVPQDVGDLWADERAVKQILFNLLSNAIKFTPEGGVISVRACPGLKGGVDLVVRDNGIGIAADCLTRLLRPFEQVDNRYSRAHGGTGLGLALVRGLAELHGGTVAIDSALGRGTTVTVSFPPRPPAENA